MVEDAPKDRPAPPANPDLDTSDAGQIKRLTELMWLMPMLIGNAVHGNTDNPPVPMGPVAAYDLDSADEQQDRDEVRSPCPMPLPLPLTLTLKPKP